MVDENTLVFIYTDVEYTTTTSEQPNLMVFKISALTGKTELAARFIIIRP